MLWALLGCPSPTTPTAPTGPTDTDTGTPTPATPAEITVQTRSEPTCVDPSARETSRFRAFTLEPPTPPTLSYLWGAGITASDFDDDGVSEVIAVHETELEYLAWDGSSWSPRAGLPPLQLTRGFGAVSVDIDDDGDQDVFVTQMPGENLLLLNDGEGTFTEATPEVLRGPVDHHSATATFADFDLDGDLDLFVGGHGHVDEAGGDPAHFEPADPSLLYWNQDGTWVDDPEALPADAHDRYTFIGGAMDLNGDRAPDLLMVNDFGRLFGSGQLLWNTPTGFVADGNAVGLDLPVAGMGLSWAEINEDDVPDLLMPEWDDYKLMLSAAGSWFDFSVPSGLKPAVPSGQEVGWGANFGDLDNDGREDAVVMHGWLATTITPNVHDQPDGVFQGLDDGFDNVTVTWDHLDRGDNRGLVLADLDGDGWLDLARPSLNGPTVIYMANCGTERWLEVRLRQPGPNPRAIGATVRVSTDDRSLTRWLLAGGEGYGSGRPAEVHFGLGSTETVDLEVEWPDGRVDRIEDQHTSRRITVVRNSESSVR